MKNFLIILFGAIAVITSITLIYAFHEINACNNARKYAEDRLAEAITDAYKTSELAKKEAERADKEALAARKARDEAQRLELLFAKCKCPK